MKIWFDADNGPHVLIMKPLIEACISSGHEVLVTARDRTNTTQLLELYGIPHEVVGGVYRTGSVGRVLGTLGRAWDLRKVVSAHRPDVSFGHGSRALPIASRMMGIPTVTMYDYEWVNASLFNICCRSILMPEAIGMDRCNEAGISSSKVRFFPGYKEELYLGTRELDQSIPVDLGLNPEKIQILLRPPATTAHYHNPEAEIILDAIMEKMRGRDDLQLIYLARTSDQSKLPVEKGVVNVIVPDRVYDGPSLVAAMDLVISGGGTMTREAGIMGVPSYSFFKGRKGNVDQKLEDDGKLIMLRSKEEVAGRLKLVKKPDPVRMPEPAHLVDFIVATILEVEKG